MRVLVISDLHANWPALEAVLGAEPFDELFVGGDLVSYGPHPGEVVETIRARGTLVVRGNHDNALAYGVDCRCAPASKPLAEATRTVHGDVLAPPDIEYLGALPLTATRVAAGLRCFSTHASPHEHLFRYTLTPAAPEDELRAETEGVDADLVLLGHTHLPMLRQVGRATLLNPGSVGQPRDGDPRASYAVIQDGVPRLARVAYDIEGTVRDVRRMPIAAEIADALVSILRTGRAGH